LKNSYLNLIFITTGSNEPHLRLISGLQDLSLTSGDRVQLKCRVDAFPNDNLKYTWYVPHSHFN